MSSLSSTTGNGTNVTGWVESRICGDGTGTVDDRDGFERLLWFLDFEDDNNFDPGRKKHECLFDRDTYCLFGAITIFIILHVCSVVKMHLKPPISSFKFIHISQRN